MLSKINTEAPKTGYKPKKCAACSNSFTPSKRLQKVCGWRCGLDWIAQQREKKIRKDIRERKDKLKRRADWIIEAQTAFNAYIRARDINAGHKCIDCGRDFEPGKPGGAIDAGHYLARSLAPQHRFNEDNCYAQKKNCNRPGGTTRAAFRAGVVARIGLEAVEALEADNAPAKWTIPELKAIRDTYRQKLKQLKQS